MLTYCDHCASLISTDALVCRFCHRATERGLLVAWAATLLLVVGGIVLVLK